MAAKGSSSRISGASCNIRRAKRARCSWPPESDPMGRDSKPAMPTASSAARTRRRCSRETPPKAPISCHRPIATTSNTDTGKLWSISPRCGM
jgi:hypothetical protein